MVLIGTPNPEYTIRCIRKNTSDTIKYSLVDDIRDSLHIPMVLVTTSMFYVIRFTILHYDLPKSVLHWNFLIPHIDILFYIPPEHGLSHNCIIFTSMFVFFLVNVISMVTAIYFCTSYDLLLG